MKDAPLSVRIEDNLIRVEATAPDGNKHLITYFDKRYGGKDYHIDNNEIKDLMAQDRTGLYYGLFDQNIVQGAVNDYLF